MKILKMPTSCTLANYVIRITQIEICDDVRNEYAIFPHMPEAMVAAADKIPVDEFHDQQEEDQYYLKYTDEDLAQLDPSVVRRFRNFDLMCRVGRVNDSLLSGSQKTYIKQRLEQKDRTHNTITDADINYLLKLIKECDNISYDEKHEATNTFAYNNRGEFRTKAVLRALRNLTFEDWKYRTRSINWSHLGNTLFIFKPRISWVDADGKQRDNIEVYVKLDVSETTKTAIALVSFHD